MGCAGSRPHLPSLGVHHSSSPHKGFILFDTKTIEYLRANESTIKMKLKERCEQKLTKISLGSKSSLLSNAKKTLLNTTNDSSSSSSTNAGGMRSNKSNVSLSGSLDANYKSEVISAAVDYVLKYALNDFDMENFKSSNHLSLKQIRKEIMKKNSKSSSKLNNSLSMNNATTSSMNDTSSNAMTSSSTMADFSSQSKSFDPVFYKQALNSAIDEFGSFIQENFIVINEFDATKRAETASNSADATVETKSIEAIKEETSAEEQAKAVEDEDEALKLKEALALARQNFYKGKVSTVCLTKGGYVVKEVSTSQSTLQTTSVTTTNQTESDNQTNETKIEQEVEQKEEDEKKEETSRVEESLADDNLELIKRLITKAFDMAQEKLTISEFNLIKTHFVNLLNETIESIVNYTTKSSAVNESSSGDQFSFDLQAAQHADLLIVNLERAKRIIESLNSIDENDFSLVDEKLVEAILNLDYVNKEFKSYLKILEESQLKELESKKQTANADDLDNAEVLINKNIKIRMLADEIDELNSRLPKKLFSCKCLPHPTEANQTLANVPQEAQAEEEVKCSEEETSVDIKKEIAMSILNVGEIIAKTIDHYSSDAKLQVAVTEAAPAVTKIEVDETTDETTEKQTELVSQPEEESPIAEVTVETTAQVVPVVEEPVVESNDELHVNVASGNEAKDAATTTSTVSSLSSPSVSTSSMSPTEPISPVDTKPLIEQSKEEDTLDLSKSPKCNSLVEATTNLDLIEKFKCAPLDDKLACRELSYLEHKYEESGSFVDLVSTNLDKDQKSSSSSSDLLTSSNQNVNQEVKFRNTDLSTESNVLTTTTSAQNQTKRMSLDEELFYHLEDVDKKVKYMNETCSENESDEDDEDENDEFDLDGVDLEQADDERLFHPRTPAKIKQEIKASTRNADLQNEIKQISNVIQDLVQTINVRNSAIHTKIDIIEEVNPTSDGHLILLDDAGSNTNTNPDSEDGGSQNSADSTDFNPSSKLKYTRNSINNTNKKLEATKRLSLNSNNSFSSIPVRQKVLTKQKATSIEDDQNEYSNKKTLSTSVNYEAFVDVTTLVKQQQQEEHIVNSPDILNKSSSSQKFRSKLPVKK